MKSSPSLFCKQLKLTLKGFFTRGHTVLFPCCWVLQHTVTRGAGAVLKKQGKSFIILTILEKWVGLFGFFFTLKSPMLSSFPLLSSPKAFWGLSDCLHELCPQPEGVTIPGEAKVRSSHGWWSGCQEHRRQWGDNWRAPRGWGQHSLQPCCTLHVVSWLQVPQPAQKLK